MEVRKSCPLKCSEHCLHYAADFCYYEQAVKLYSGKVICGSDNGKSGSMVFLDIDSGKIVHIENYPDAKRMYKLLTDFRPKYAVIEQVFMAAGFKNVASTNFEIMGRYKQLFELLDIPYDAVRAVSWRKALNIKAKGRPAQKAASIVKAQELFNKDFDCLCTDYGHIKDHKRVIEREPDDNKCESALIAYYALQQYKKGLVNEA